MSVLPAQLSVYHMCIMPPRGQKRVSATLELELQMAESHMRVLGMEQVP